MFFFFEKIQVSNYKSIRLWLHLYCLYSDQFEASHRLLLSKYKSKYSTDNVYHFATADFVLPNQGSQNISLF
jgi:hypothetical protein